MDSIKKIINWFKKHLNSLTSAVQGSLASDEQCHKRGLHLEKKQLNRTIALLIILGVGLFIGGYFLGQHVATEQVLNAVERDSFADQIYYSMCSAQEQKDDEEESVDEESGDAQEATEKDEEQEDAPTQGESAGGKSQKLASGVSKTSQEAQQPAAVKSQKTYYAQIAGFGQHKTAEKYAQQLKNRGFKVHVAKRVSRSARGRTVSWYQVVTDDFHDVQEGERVVSLLRVQENLRNITLTEK